MKSSTATRSTPPRSSTSSRPWKPSTAGRGACGSSTAAFASRRPTALTPSGQPAAGCLAPLGSTEDNLQWLRERGACYLVGTPKPQLNAFEQHLTEKDWQKASGEVEVKLCPNDDDVYVLARSQGRVQKEQAMRRRVLKACVRDLIKLRRSVARGSLKDSKLIERRIAHLEERHRPMWRFLKHCRHDETKQRVEWEWDRDKWQAAVKRDGAYLLRAQWPGQHSAAELWQTYVQLAPFASSGSVGLRPAYRQPISRLPPALGSPRPRPC